jgi:hypothetical protein
MPVSCHPSILVSVSLTSTLCGHHVKAPDGGTCSNSSDRCAGQQQFGTLCHELSTTCGTLRHMLAKTEPTEAASNMRTNSLL